MERGVEAQGKPEAVKAARQHEATRRYLDEVFGE